MSRLPHRQQGISIVAAIFVLVVLAAIGIYMATIASLQHATGAASVQGTRAVFAAQSGLEWAIRDAAHNGAGSLNCGGAPPAPFTLSGGSLAGFQVRVLECIATPVTEGAVSYNVYNLTVRASRGNVGSADYTSRTIRATVTDAAPP